MSKEPFTIDHDTLDEVCLRAEEEGGGGSRAVRQELARQICAYDPSLPADLEGQLRELMARPTFEAMRMAFVRDLMAVMPSAEKLVEDVAKNLGRPLAADDCALVIATLDELVGVFVGLAPVKVPHPPSIGNPFEPPKPPSKARESIDDTIDKLLAIKSGDRVEDGILEKIQDVARELKRVRQAEPASLGIPDPPPPPPPTKAVEGES